MRYLTALIIIILPFFSYAGDLVDAMSQSAAGMRVQGARMKVVSQNIANSSSTGNYPGAEPYRRQTIFFKNKPDRETGVETVHVDKVSKDYKTEFEARYDPSHPAADNDGYVLLPNVKSEIEMLDMKESEAAYQANLGAIETSKKMYTDTIDLLK